MLVTGSARDPVGSHGFPWCQHQIEDLAIIPLRATVFEVIHDGISDDGR